MRVGFEGGQTPLYRRLPKLRGIAGGMPKGRQTHVTVNLSTLSAAVAVGKLEEGAEVSLAVLKEKGLLKATGAQRNLPLKVLAGGGLIGPLKIAANAFSAGAREKIEAAGGSITETPGKIKWTRKQHEANVRVAEAAEAAAPKKAAKKVKA